MKKRLNSVWQILPIFGLAILICLALYGRYAGIFTSIDSLQIFITQFGRYGVILFFIIQITQTIVPILPSGISTIAGMLAFGYIWGFIYSYIGSIIGELIVYYLARHYGHTFAKLILSPKNYEKFERIIEKNQTHVRRFLVFAFLVPFAPDDIACLAAGFLRMRFRDYLLIILILKPISIALYSYIFLNAITILSA